MNHQFSKTFRNNKKINVMQRKVTTGIYRNRNVSKISSDEQNILQRPRALT